VTGLQSALDGKQVAGSYQPLATVLTNTTASFTTAQETKLAGVSTGATANAADAALRDRATHTGVQTIATVTGLQTALDGKQAAGSYAAASHTHTIADVTGLQTALDGKLATGGEAGTVATINGKIAAGANVTITGSGTTASPYVVAASGGGGASPLGLHDFWQETWFASNNAAAPVRWVGGVISGGSNSAGIPTASFGDKFRHGVFLRSGTTANGGYRYMTTSPSGDNFGQASHKFRAVFKWLTSFTGRTVRNGFLDTTTSAAPVDGAYFEIVGDVCSAITANNSARTTNPTTITLSLGIPYIFDPEVNEAGTEARFRVYNGVTGATLMDVTNTTNIPTTATRAVGSGIVATEASTTISDIGILYMLGEGTVAGFTRARG
jgi:hypothetical protein